jgi:hypothetical protein
MRQGAVYGFALFINLELSNIIPWKLFWLKEQ